MKENISKISTVKQCTVLVRNKSETEEPNNWDFRRLVDFTEDGKAICYANEPSALFDTAIRQTWDEWRHMPQEHLKIDLWYLSDSIYKFEDGDEFLYVTSEGVHLDYTENIKWSEVTKFMPIYIAQQGE